VAFSRGGKFWPLFVSKGVALVQKNRNWTRAQWLSRKRRDTVLLLEREKR
jgi:hypothetical protein